jgi:hypothetical protein
MILMIVKKQNVGDCFEGVGFRELHPDEILN